MKGTSVAVMGFLAAAALFTVITAGPAGTDPGGVAAEIAVLQAQVASLQTQVATLQANNALAIGPYVSVSPGTIDGLKGPHVIFHGANIHIESGSGSTVDNTGLGNLVIGYNEGNTPIDAMRTGSHNLVVGPDHEFTASGGLVAGFENAVVSNYSTVSGGICNGAGAGATPPSPACLLGNTAGEGASVSGGQLNVATGFVASVSGGSANTASGEVSSVSGGGGNTASALEASASGGNGNTANGQLSSISGGESNAITLLGTSASISGGIGNMATNFTDSVSGGADQRGEWRAFQRQRRPGEHGERRRVERRRRTWPDRVGLRSERQLARARTDGLARLFDEEIGGRNFAVIDELFAPELTFRPGGSLTGALDYLAMNYIGVEFALRGVRHDLTGRCHFDQSR
jgi:hypothetical protein